MSYTKVGPDKYRIFISDGTNLDGSRRRPSKTVTTDLTGRDLERFLTLAEYDFEDEIKKKDPRFQELAKGTFESYSNWWLQYKKISDKTRANYESFLNVRILQLIGNKILDKITTGDMLELMEIIETTPSELTKKLLSAGTIRHYHKFLTALFSDAVKFKILNENPMENVPIVSDESKKSIDNFYDIEDIESLLEALPAAPTRYQLATLLTISTVV